MKTELFNQAKSKLIAAQSCHPMAVQTLIEEVLDALDELASEPTAQVVTDERHPLMVFARECELGGYQEHEIPLAARKAINSAKVYGIAPKAVEVQL